MINNINNNNSNKKKEKQKNKKSEDNNQINLKKIKTKIHNNIENKKDIQINNNLSIPDYLKVNKIKEGRIKSYSYFTKE